LATEYADAAKYYWCQFDLAKLAKEQDFDEVTYNAVQAQIDLGQALIKAAKGRLKGVKGGKDTIDAIVDIREGMEKIGSAAKIAGKGFNASAIQDESFRKAMNAMHQPENAENIAQWLKVKSTTDPNCPPPDEQDNSAEQGLPDADGDGVAGSYSGFGMKVEILRNNSLRITSDCQDRDHRIQLRGPSGTWSTKGVGKPVIIVPDINPELTYRVRRRCEHKYSPVLVVDIPAMTAPGLKRGK